MMFATAKLREKLKSTSGVPRSEAKTDSRQRQGSRYGCSPAHRIKNGAFAGGQRRGTKADRLQSFFKSSQIW
jgi:hypothetical protein